MTLTTVGWVLLGWCLASFAVAGLWVAYKARVKRQAVQAVPEPAKAWKRHRGPLLDGFCPYCHEPGIYLTRTGQPNRRYHICDPAAVQAQVWPPGSVMGLDGKLHAPAQANDPPSWPPAPAETPKEE